MNHTPPHRPLSWLTGMIRQVPNIYIYIYPYNALIIMSYLGFAKRLFARICFPYLKKRYGNGIIATVRKASTLVAHWYPSLLYICTPKRGNTAGEELVRLGKFCWIWIGFIFVCSQIKRRVERIEELKRTSKRTAHETVCCQWTSGILRIGVNKECEYPCEDEKVPIVRHKSASWYHSRGILNPRQQPLSTLPKSKSNK